MSEEGGYLSNNLFVNKTIWEISFADYEDSKSFKEFKYDVL